MPFLVALAVAIAAIIGLSDSVLLADDFAAPVERQSADRRDIVQSVPGCAETAAFSLLVSLGKRATFAELRATLESLAPDGKLDPRNVSMKSLRDALTRHGVPTVATRIYSRDLSQLRVPCILYVRPDKRSNGPVEAGHFVTFVGWRNKNAVVLDWSPNSIDPEFEVPINHLQSFWTGEAVVPSDVSQLETFGISTLFLLSAACLVFVCMPLRKAPTTICLAALLISGSGCSDRKGAAPKEDAVLTLAFEQPVRSLNNVTKGKKTDIKFPFKTWNHSPVRITSIERGCGCIELVNDLTNHELLPDSSHTLEVRFRPQGPGGEKGVQRIELLTDPPSPSPLVLMISYRLRDELVISGASVVVDAKPGEAPSSSLLVTYHRNAATKALKLDLSKSSATHFEIRGQAPTVTEADPWKSTVTDSLELRLQGQRPFAIGRHEGKVTLAFANGETRVLDSTIVVGHPFKPRLTDVFVGRLRQGEQWQKEVPVDETSSTRSTPGDIKIDSDIVSARITTTPSILLTGRAPSEPGKFSSAVELRFDSQKLPSVKINVWGIVTN